MTIHHQIELKARTRGFHLITQEVLSEIRDSFPEQGILHLFIQHTSAGLAINENADPSVRMDFESYFNEIVRENAPFLTHTLEGTDDMPAHVKSVLSGSSVSIPILNGWPALGKWQGIYLCEFRNRATSRKIIASIVS